MPRLPSFSSHSQDALDNDHGAHSPARAQIDLPLRTKTIGGTRFGSGLPAGGAHVSGNAVPSTAIAARNGASSPSPRDEYLDRIGTMRSLGSFIDLAGSPRSHTTTEVSSHASGVGSGISRLRSRSWRKQRRSNERLTDEPMPVFVPPLATSSQRPSATDFTANSGASRSRRSSSPSSGGSAPSPTSGRVESPRRVGIDGSGTNSHPAKNEGPWWAAASSTAVPPMRGESEPDAIPDFDSSSATADPFSFGIDTSNKYEIHEDAPSSIGMYDNPLRLPAIDEEYELTMPIPEELYYALRSGYEEDELDFDEGDAGTVQEVVVRAVELPESLPVEMPPEDAASLHDKKSKCSCAIM
eukprot:GEMP01017175.1.p1 GENE.GEMP01017175.1~~GEMP01017175.1.p1  ORF type:complete len:355 (+),score=83.22 GEMP01017175.1:643-1707(+)